MAAIEMCCGECGGYLNVDVDDDWADTIMLWGHRFVNAHTGCGTFSGVEYDATTDDPPVDTAPGTTIAIEDMPHYCDHLPEPAPPPADVGTDSASQG